MTTREIATLRFVDTSSGDEAVTIVRVGDGDVGLALSLMQDGDVEVFLRLADCEALIEALQRAVSTVRTP